MNQKQYSVFSLPVIVGALGLFVDVYDLLLFSIIRKPSLAALGLRGDEITNTGEWIISIQMIGLVVGGIFWGVLGDKRGRLNVLFGSILLYSIANIANGMVHTIPQYIIIRFIAGIGLAGEMGASITLVSEILPKEKRGIAAAIITSLGVLGAVLAYEVYNYFQDWRLCYYIGGGIGLLLLLLRVSILESGMYDEVKKTTIERGNFFMFFTNKDRFFRYMRGVIIGLPVWYAIGVLITFADKFGKEMGIANVDPGKAVMYQYFALCFGDLAAGILSNILKSRKKALFTFFIIQGIFTILYFLQAGGSAERMYWLCAGLGFGSGFSVLYITMSAEQFGTNLRATAAISIPNMVRGGLPLILLLFRGIRSLTGHYVSGGWITGIILMAMAVIAAYYTKESFGKDLNFVET
ncbi:MFS transporter [Ferruginibacter albus]|uniref:MFS transporter n=1 Tax=Ferruginibacter albus TaxID=2875540 RepID=UPI001CC76982|nr:MFS transporter [Ferruginibacter albus]UAY52311.1 MFS transporter [Ferruginibacter albus]